MTKVSRQRGYSVYRVKLEDVECQQLFMICKREDGSHAEALRRVIERGLNDLTGELPAVRKFVAGEWNDK